MTVEEVARLIDSARNLLDRTLLMVLYSTGMRNFELPSVQVKDIDSKSMLIHIQRGKGGRDRYVPLTRKRRAPERTTEISNAAEPAPRKHGNQQSCRRLACC